MLVLYLQYTASLRDNHTTGKSHKRNIDHDHWNMLNQRPAPKSINHQLHNRWVLMNRVVPALECSIVACKSQIDTNSTIYFVATDMLCVMQSASSLSSGEFSNLPLYSYYWYVLGTSHLSSKTLQCTLVGVTDLQFLFLPSWLLTSWAGKTESNFVCRILIKHHAGFRHVELWQHLHVRCIDLWLRQGPLSHVFQLHSEWGQRTSLELLLSPYMKMNKVLDIITWPLKSMIRHAAVKYPGAVLMVKCSTVNSVYSYRYQVEDNAFFWSNSTSRTNDFVFWMQPSMCLICHP